MDAVKIGQRAVGCKHWRWVSGMRDRGGNVYLGQRANAPSGVHQWARLDGGAWEWHEVEFGLPDFTDAATLGCLMALVRDAYNDMLALRQGCGWWDVETDGMSWDYDNTSSLAEALVLALEAAP